jgi:hypothetical protein
VELLLFHGRGDHCNCFFTMRLLWSEERRRTSSSLVLEHVKCTTQPAGAILVPVEYTSGPTRNGCGCTRKNSEGLLLCL